jgi:hypothetical protein
VHSHEFYKGLDNNCDIAVEVKTEEEGSGIDMIDLIGL